MTNTNKIISYINPHISVGDKVRLIDGSGLGHNKMSKKLYIIFAYPEITGSDKLLKDITFTVVEVNISDTVSCATNSTVYLQDIVIEYRGCQFNTCSDFVLLESEYDKYEERMSNFNL